MVCHETYKDQNDNWLYPEEIEKIDKKALKNQISLKYKLDHQSLCLNQKKILLTLKYD